MQETEVIMKTASSRNRLCPAQTWSTWFRISPVIIYYPFLLLLKFFALTPYFPSSNQLPLLTRTWYYKLNQETRLQKPNQLNREPKFSRWNHPRWPRFNSPPINKGKHYNFTPCPYIESSCVLSSQTSVMLVDVNNSKSLLWKRSWTGWGSRSDKKQNL